ncbi:two-component sensor histidine kinase [Bordetella genomosp. 1]|uniref:histidine kinase n=1 Tax=Bordetella genomosp. 1 TaxID=1395607 RepID=A0A261RV51_9BORD|nr:HAMP domain-containing sensor histidine kinase [Bordetella genomosp. 1]OZI28771.1 two-component sensor histidine kinase [Bordetella genomosp. 1]OZI55830.1 two-component sensor histidine kinase [Bordetella genomosp. 1]
MSRPGALTQRVVWALTGTVTVFVTVLALLSYLTFDQMEDDLVNDILTTETERLIQHLATGERFMADGGQGPRELGGSMRAWLIGPGQPDNMLPLPLRGLDNGLTMIEPGAETWHVMVADAGRHRGRVYLLYDATDNEERVQNFGLFVLGIGAICVVLAYGLSRRIAAVAVGPLVDLTQRLSNWAPGAADLAVQRDDEAGRLIEAFNRVQNQVDRSIAREREFAANLSHEIRTPLAGIRSDSEMMLLDPGLAAPVRTRLQRIVDNVDSVSSSLESARALARDQPRPPEPVDLAQCMRDAWQGFAVNAEQAGLRFVNAIPDDIERNLDRYALLTVLRNLVRNAIEHAAPAELVASLDIEGALVLADNGRGIAPEELPFVFQRYYSGRLRDSGEAGAGELPGGLGLAIAKRVCDMQGWTLQVFSSREAEDRGTRFVLRLDGTDAPAPPPSAA